jgi:hypothetical protein
MPTLKHRPGRQPKPASRAALGTLAALALSATALPAGALPLDPSAFASLGTLNLGAGQYTLSTDGALPTLLDGGANLLATGWYQAQADAFNPKVAVFSFDAIQVAAGATITASGANPLALLSRGDITFAGTLDAAGRTGGPQGAGVGGRGGPGAGRGGNGGGGEGEPGQGPGGGQGGYPGLGNGSWGEGGAYGGAGSNWNPARTPALPYGDPAVVLQGGSGGGAGGANLFGSGPGGGGGGGGVELGALGHILLSATALLNASGGTTLDGLAVNAGGGSGGGLLLHADSIELQSQSRVDASGFSGGRITFLTASGPVTGNLSGVSVGANFYGHEGVITYGTLPAVPEPASALLWLAGGMALLAWRRRPGLAVPASGRPA